MNSIFRRGKNYFSGSVGHFRLLTFLFIGAGILLRLEYLREYAQLENFNLPIGADIAEYHQRACELLAGQLFPAHPEIHAPLYSLVLALLYKVTNFSVPAVRFIQLTLNFGAWLGLFALCRRWNFTLKEQLAFLALGMLTPILIFHQGELISETLLLPIFTGIFYLLTKITAPAPPRHAKFYWLGCGALTALAALTHGAMLAFAGFEIIYLFARKKFPAALWFALGIIILLLPVIGIKSSHYGRFTGTQNNGGFNFYLGNNPEADGTCYLRPGLKWRQLHRQAQQTAQQKRISTDQLWLQRAARFWLDQPGQALKLYLRKAVLIWDVRENIAGSDPGALICRTDLMFWGRFLLPVLFILSWVGLLRYRQEHTEIAHHFGLLLAAVIALQILFVTSGRYRLAMFPALIFFAACGIKWFNTKLRGLLLLVPVVLSAWWSWDFATANLSEAQALIGEACYLKGDYPQAETLLLQAQTHYRDPAQTGNILGAIYQKSGRLVQALNCYQKVTEIEPDMPEAWMNLGNLLGGAGSERNLSRQKAAERCFKKAFQVASPSADLFFNYALFLQRHTPSSPQVDRYLNLALQKNPRHAPALNAVGIKALLNKNPRRAISFFERAVAAAPAEPGYRNNLNVARQITYK